MLYKYRKTYISELGESERFLSVCPKNISINKNMPYSLNTLVESNETCFNEVQIKPFELDEFETDFIKEVRSIKPHDAMRWQQCVFNSLKRIVFRDWNPEMFHIIPHSGGYDSRIISTIIRQLTKEHGREWLGEHLFVEVAGEKPEFEAIMKVQGFTRYLSINQSVYYPYSFNFDNYTNRFNGYSSYPVNIWHDPFEILERRGDIPKYYQMITGFGAYVERAVKKIGFVEFFRKNYYYQLGTFKWKGQQIMPFFDTEYWLTLKKYRQLWHHKQRTSEIICNTLLTNMSHIPRPTPQQIQERKLRVLSGKLFNEVNRNYLNSFVGKNSHVRLQNHIDYSDYWSYFNAARLWKKLKTS